MALLEILERETSEEKATALATYRQVLQREAAGSPDAGDAADLRDCLRILSLTVGDATADVEVLRQADDVASRIVPNAEKTLAEMATRLGELAKAKTQMEERHRVEVREEQESRMNLDSAYRRTSDNHFQAIDRLEQIKAGNPRLWSAE